MQPLDLGLGGGERGPRSPDGIVALVERGELDPGGFCEVEQLAVRLGVKAATKIGEPFELGLDLLDPARLRLEGVQEPAQLGAYLPDCQLGPPESLSGGSELGGEMLERRDPALGRRDQVGAAFVLVGRDRRECARCGIGELGDMTQAFPFGRAGRLLPRAAGPRFPRRARAARRSAPQRPQCRS